MRSDGSLHCIGERCIDSGAIQFRFVWIKYWRQLYIVYIYIIHPVKLGFWSSCSSERATKNDFHGLLGAPRVKHWCIKSYTRVYKCKKRYKRTKRVEVDSQQKFAWGDWWERWGLPRVRSGDLAFLHRQPDIRCENMKLYIRKPEMPCEYIWKYAAWSDMPPKYT